MVHAAVVSFISLKKSHKMSGFVSVFGIPAAFMLLVSVLSCVCEIRVLEYDLCVFDSIINLSG